MYLSHLPHTTPQTATYTCHTYHTQHHRLQCIPVTPTAHTTTDCNIYLSHLPHTTPQTATYTVTPTTHNTTDCNLPKTAIHTHHTCTYISFNMYPHYFGICSTPMLPQKHVKDPGHSAKSAGGRLQLNTHTPYICGFA